MRTDPPAPLLIWQEAVVDRLSGIDLRARLKRYVWLTGEGHGPSRPAAARCNRALGRGPHHLQAEGAGGRAAV
jgi:hypothetical protein